MRREIHNNDLLLCGHHIVAKNAQAFSEDSNKFSEPITRLVYIEQDENINNIVEMANNFNMSRDVVRKQLLREVSIDEREDTENSR